MKRKKSSLEIDVEGKQKKKRDTAGPDVGQ